MNGDSEFIKELAMKVNQAERDERFTIACYTVLVQKYF